MSSFRVSWTKLKQGISLKRRPSSNFLEVASWGEWSPSSKGHIWVSGDLSERGYVLNEEIKRCSPGIEEESRFEHRLSLGILALTLLVDVGIRLRLAPIPLERDEGEYALLGQMMLSGVPPYVEAANMKWPGTYAMHAIGMAIFGQTPTGVHLTLLAVNVASVLVVFLIGRKLFGVFSGAIAAAAFSSFMISQRMLGFASHASHYVVFMAILGFWLILRWRDSGRFSTLFCGAAYFGLAAIMKQPGLAFAFVGPVVIVEKLACEPRGNLRKIDAAIVTFIVGLVSPFVFMIALLSITNSLSSFLYWTLGYASSYGANGSWSDIGWRMISMFHLLVWNNNQMMLIGAAMGIIGIIIDSRMSNSRGALLSFSVASIIAVLPGFHFRGHYFLLLGPAVALLLGAGVAVFRHRSIATFPVKAISAMVMGMGLLAAIQPILATSTDYVLSPQQFARRIYFPNPFCESADVAQYLKDHTDPSEAIAVIGSEPQIYFLSHRRPASPFIYMYPLVENQPYAKEMQEKFIADVTKANPKFLVFVRVKFSWIHQPGVEDKVIPWFQKLSKEKYKLCGVVNIDLEGSQFFWDDQIKPGRKNSENSILIYRRK